MIASLPMYMCDANRAAHDALWVRIRDALRDAGISAPDALDHEIGTWDSWGSDALVLGQICSLPFRAAFKDKVTLIGAMDYGLEDCPPGHYRSVFVVREDHPAQAPTDLIDATMAYNDGLSHSGWASPHDFARRHGLRFRPVLRTGAHLKSLEAVVAGQVDFASLDAQSFEVFRRFSDLPAKVRVIGGTEPSPGMSLITRKGEDPGPYLSAVRQAIDLLDTEWSETLGLRDVIALPRTAYDLPIPPTPEEHAGVTLG